MDGSSARADGRGAPEASLQASASAPLPSSNSSVSVAHHDAAPGTFLSALSTLRSLALSPLDTDTVRGTVCSLYPILAAASTDELSCALETLHRSDHFAAYITLLHARLRSFPRLHFAQLPHLLSSYALLVSQTPALTARILPAEWLGAGRHAARLIIDARDIPGALRLLPVLRDASEKLSANNDDNLVPLHADFLAVCLQSKSYSIAADWARRRRFGIDVRFTSITASDVLLIYYYSALAFIGVKQFRAALQCCRLALAVPASSIARLHDAVVAAYKKYVLLYVLVHAKLPPALKFSSYTTSRLRDVAVEYFELAAAYDRRSKLDINEVFAAHRAIFEKDANLGLVKQVVRAFSREIIVRLSASFVTMRLDDVATRAMLSGREEAVHVLVEMIGDGIIHASIDERDGIVTLIENHHLDRVQHADHQTPTPHVITRMHQHMATCIDTLRRIQLFKDSLVQHPLYVRKELFAERRRASAQRGACFGDRDMPPTSTAAALEAELLM